MQVFKRFFLISASLYKFIRFSLSFISQNSFAFKCWDIKLRMQPVRRWKYLNKSSGFYDNNNKFLYTMNGIENMMDTFVRPTDREASQEWYNLLKFVPQFRYIAIILHDIFSSSADFTVACRWVLTRTKYLGWEECLEMRSIISGLNGITRKDLSFYTLSNAISKKLKETAKFRGQI